MIEIATTLYFIQLYYLEVFIKLNFHAKQNHLIQHKE